MTYGCKVWTTTKCDNETSELLKIKYGGSGWYVDQFVTQEQMNGEGSSIRNFKKNIQLVTSYIKGQRIQLLGHIIYIRFGRSEEETIRAVLEWKLVKEKSPRQTEEDMAQHEHMVMEELETQECRNERKLFETVIDGGMYSDGG